MGKTKEAKDLKIKFGTKDETLWTEVKRQCKIQIEQAENTLKVQNEVLKLAEVKISEEERKRKESIN